MGLFEESYGSLNKNSVPPHTALGDLGLPWKIYGLFGTCIEEALLGLLIDRKPLVYVLLPGSEELV